MNASAAKGGDLFGYVPDERPRYPNFPGSKERANLSPSREAARAVAGHANTVRANVLRFLHENHPTAFRADEIAKRLDLSILTVRPRVSELAAAQLIERTGERGKNASGMSAMWRVKR
jgi:hypothetical protein